jgi:hypothetical protein
LLGVAVGLSIVGIAIGPALVMLGRANRSAHAAVDGFLLGLMPALVAVRILPELYAELGASSVGLLALGFAGMWILSRSGAPRLLATWLAVATFAVHSLVDGATLAVACRSGVGSALALGLVSHRLPEGLFVGKQLLPRLGGSATAGVTVLLAASTALGAASAQSLLGRVDPRPMQGIVAIGLGAMLRVALHRHGGPTPRGDWALGTIGFVVGVVVALIVPGASE